MAADMRRALPPVMVISYECNALSANSSVSCYTRTDKPIGDILQQSIALCQPQLSMFEHKKEGRVMSDYQYILVERNQRVGIATLNRPKELNALRTELVGELAAALEEFDHDEEIRCIVIT